MQVLTILAGSAVGIAAASGQQNMKFQGEGGMEVVGARLTGHKDEGRLTTTPSHGSAQPPATPEDSVLLHLNEDWDHHGHVSWANDHAASPAQYQTPPLCVFREASDTEMNGSRGCESSSWKRPPFPQGQRWRSAADVEGDSVSRGETGIKVKIAYVDGKGRRVTANSRANTSARPRSRTTHGLERTPDLNFTSNGNDLGETHYSTHPSAPVLNGHDHHPLHLHQYDLNFTNSGSIDHDFENNNNNEGDTTDRSVVDRLYNPRRISSAKERAFSSVLGKGSAENGVHNQAHQNDNGFNNHSHHNSRSGISHKTIHTYNAGGGSHSSSPWSVSFPSQHMPSIQRSRTQLTKSSKAPSSSNQRPTSYHAGHSKRTPGTMSNKSGVTINQPDSVRIAGLTKNGHAHSLASHSQPGSLRVRTSSSFSDGTASADGSSGSGGGIQGNGSGSGGSNVSSGGVRGYSNGSGGVRYSNGSGGSNVSGGGNQAYSNGGTGGSRGSRDMEGEDGADIDVPSTFTFNHFFPRPATTTGTAGKRVQFSTYQDCMRERLKTAIAQRRQHSASRLVALQKMDNAAAISLAYVRVRGRRRLVLQQQQKKVVDEKKPPSESRMFRKFRMVARVTITLMHLKAAIVINSLDRTERSAAEIQWRTLYGEQEAEKLAFNKSLFSRERISTKMPNWALRIFDIDPEDRTEQDCRRLHALFRGMRSFDKFTEEIQLKLCRAFSYTCVGESRIVLRRGHIGFNFYFIYSGSVFVNVQDTDSEGEPFIKTEAILGKGDSFGELALLQDIRRTATISVREACEFLVVDKDVFSKVCPKIFENELLEKKAFISRLSLFSKKWWTAEALDSLCMEAQIQEFKINKIIVENNTMEDWLYIVMEGKCQVIRCLGTGEEEVENDTKGRNQSAVLSEEIIELLSSAAAHAHEDEEEEKEESSKEKLLSSLGLEYVQTGKRRGVFIAEVEEEERRKALLASAGPMTLTSLIASQRKEGKTDLVYVNVGSLEAEDVFDMGSLIKPPSRRTNSALILVSSGARMLRVKKSLFLRLTSPQAVEHTKTLVSKQSLPTEASIMESYRQKVTWNKYKHQVVNDIVNARDLRQAPAFRPTPGNRDMKFASSLPDKSQRRGRASSNAKDKDKAKITAEKKEESATVVVVVGCTEEDEKQTGENATDENQTGVKATDEGSEETKVTVHEITVTDDEIKVTGDEIKVTDEEITRITDGETKADKGAPIFPVVEVDTYVDPLTPTPTPREGEVGQQGSKDEAETNGTVSTFTNPHPFFPPTAMDRELEKFAPTKVIVRRRSSVGLYNRPVSLAHEATFVERRHKSREEPVSGQLARFAETDLAEIREENNSSSHSPERS